MSILTAKKEQKVEFEVKTQKKQGGGRFFFFILIVVCVGLCIVVSQFFSNIISTGSVSFSTFSTASSDKYTLYAVSLGSYPSQTQADDYAVSVRAKNAGGYVYKNNGKFFVIASIYEKKNDAESVAENLSTAGNSAEIVELNVEKVNFNKISTQSLKKEFIEFLSLFKDVYTNMYDISVSLDTSVFSEAKAKIEVDGLKTKLSAAIEKLSNGTSSADGVYYVIIKNKAQNIIDELDEVVNFNETDTYPLGAKIKNTYISVVCDILDVVELLNQE